jgi:hypothetical protein
VTLQSVATFAPPSPAALGRQTEPGVADNATVEPLPFAVGTAAFEFGNFISNAIAAASFISDSRSGEHIAPSGPGTLGMIGIGNFALLAAGLIGVGLTRRRDYIPPG